jgi:long-chain acyl-CoA synthetase
MSAPTITRQEALARLTAKGEPYELETLTINGRPNKTFKKAPASLRAMFEAARSDKTFYVFEDERVTYEEAWNKAAQIAHLLVNRFGVKKGDRVAISMRNYPEWPLAFMAATSVGAIAVAMNALWQPDELEYGLIDCGAKVFVADQERLDRLAQCNAKVQTLAVRATRRDPAIPDLAALMAEVCNVPMPDANIAPEDFATIFYTSGSTGHPKGVISTQRNVITAMFSWELDGQAGALVTGIPIVEPAQQPATLLAVPLFHVTGSHAVLLTSYRSQRRIIAMYKWDPAAAAEIIEREKITTFVAPAAMTGDLVREAKRSDRDLSTLLTVGGGGAPRAPDQVAQIEKSFGKALPNTGWGMTETNAIGTGIGGLDYLGRPASSGRCSAVLEIKIVDEKGNTLPANQRGELLIRGTSMFQGYWNRDELNKTLFEDGWFRTGDVAYLDDEGFVFIVDRIKDLIIRGGENIGCGSVEAALLTHPDVHEAAVYAVPDERLGEEVGATIYGPKKVDIEALRLYLRERLAAFEVPRYIVQATEPLPRTGSGKILKRELRDLAVAHFAKEPA